ncbi:hypothetical protein PRIPAC_76244 [Pristionchus pacificus]|uniref:Uncharacterized protein n=1 Tax=Pristionchus pacificus TaxID=54126 RepID=A0A454XMV6_PRIPA|nr:hypothetical protein PRIPAC_76244 [Pristionchus pacificus]|eukprot:PDM73330.1 hypothetical protein PRIPAC_40686 [Pristionchus pacificus]
MSTKFLILLLVLISASAVYAASVRVEACDEVCRRTVPERNQCCRAHGYQGMIRGMCTGNSAYCNKAGA